jgi:UPF0755 protein
LRLATRKKSPNEGPAQTKAYKSNRKDKRKRRRGAGRFVRALLGVILTFGCIALAGVVVLLIGKDAFESGGPLTKDTTVMIERGSGTSDIAAKLSAAGVISDERLFQGGVLINRAQGTLKAGEYAFPAKISMAGVMDMLVKGKSIVYKISVPEGLTSQQAVERLLASKKLTGDIAAVPTEGSLLPDTYVYENGATRADIVKQMQIAQRRLVAELWPQRAENLPVRTAREAIILASIVEKETGVAEERPRVAAVFLNRLKKGMRLQSDPTIIYGIVGGKGKLGRAITRSDIQRKTRYNTYHIKALPPTPIANPGKDAIMAVLNPVSSEDLFFVADGTGGHVFAKTLKEHEENVRKWREIEAARRAEEEAKKVAAERATTVSSSPEGSPVPDLNDLRATAATAEKAVEADFITEAMAARFASSGLPLPRQKPATSQ